MQVILICGLFTVMAPHTSEQWILVTGGKGNYKGRKEDVEGRDRLAGGQRLPGMAEGAEAPSQAYLSSNR
jgi:hypothetical protein